MCLWHFIATVLAAKERTASLIFKVYPRALRKISKQVQGNQPNYLRFLEQKNKHSNLKKTKKLLLLLTGPDLPGVSDCDSETDQDESSSSSAFVIPVQFNVHQLPTVSVDVESTASTIRIQDNSIKLVVPSGFASPNSAGGSSDGKPDGN